MRAKCYAEAQSRVKKIYYLLNFFTCHVRTSKNLNYLFSICFQGTKMYKNFFFLPSSWWLVFWGLNITSHRRQFLLHFKMGKTREQVRHFPTQSNTIKKKLLTIKIMLAVNMMLAEAGFKPTTQRKTTTWTQHLKPPSHPDL